MSKCESSDENCTEIATLRSGGWIISYHEHEGGPCLQDTQPLLGCAHPVEGWDCQFTSEGKYACTHIQVDGVSVPTKPPLPQVPSADPNGKIGKPESLGSYAWMINEIMMATRGHGYVTRNKFPDKAVPLPTKEAVIDSCLGAKIKIDVALTGLKNIVHKPKMSG